MQTVDRHLTVQCLRAIALVAVSLTSMMLLFALFDELAESADRYGLDDALNYLWRTLPRRLEDLLVYSVFIGYLAALGQMAEQGELTALRAAGVSPKRFMRGLAPSMLLCLGIMFSTFIIFAVASIVCCAMLYKYIQHQKVAKQWGDGVRGMRYQTARQTLLALEKMTETHAKNWRPQVRPTCHL